MEILDYNIINDVYGNFISFQEFLSNELTELDSNKELEILEIGTGTGITTEIILKSRKNIKLTSIDIDKEMIEFASQTLSSFSNVNFIVSDAFDYTKTISANNFDFVVSGFTIHNFTNNYRQILFNEIYRILKPKGIFINADKFVSITGVLQKSGFSAKLNIRNSNQHLY
jgi:ubiquinone/menaquinone biosynthesis C-methylase UbiE